MQVPINLGTVPEELNIGGIDSYGVDQSADPDAVTRCRGKDFVRLVGEHYYL